MVRARSGKGSCAPSGKRRVSPCPKPRSKPQRITSSPVRPNPPRRSDSGTSWTMRTIWMRDDTDAATSNRNSGEAALDRTVHDAGMAGGRSGNAATGNSGRCRLRCRAGTAGEGHTWRGGAGEAPAHADAIYAAHRTVEARSARAIRVSSGPRRPISAMAEQSGCWKA